MGFVSFSLYWMIIALQCGGLCCTSVQISHNYTYICVCMYLSPLPSESPSPTPHSKSRSSQSARLGSLCYLATSHFTHDGVYMSMPLFQFVLPAFLLTSVPLPSFALSTWRPYFPLKWALYILFRTPVFSKSFYVHLLLPPENPRDVAVNITVSGWRRGVGTWLVWGQSAGNQ